MKSARPRRWSSVLVAGFCLAGCATNYSPRPSTGEKARQALTQPISDLNMSRIRIPTPLLGARSAPFSPALALDCGRLAAEVRVLTEILGPVLSTAAAAKPPASKQPDAEAAAWGAARSATGGLIPFRGVVRWLSGAEQQQRTLDNAILAGFVRRAYLEGIRDERRCPSE